jgi:hypothetical protein
VLKLIPLRLNVSPQSSPAESVIELVVNLFEFMFNEVSHWWYQDDRRDGVDDGLLDSFGTVPLVRSPKVVDPDVVYFMPHLFFPFQELGIWNRTEVDTVAINEPHDTTPHPTCEEANRGQRHALTDPLSHSCISKASASKIITSAQQDAGGEQ